MTPVSTAPMFSRIAARYDRINTVLSLGRHRQWKRALGKFLPPGRGLSVLDTASGTGDTALELIRHYPSIHTITALDASHAMLALARRKVCRFGAEGNMRLTAGDALNLPFRDRSFDAVTMSFGIRNTDDPKKALTEACRVLRDGGRMIILEFARPQNPLFRWPYFLYMKVMVEGVGGMLSGDRPAYAYLTRSICDFPCGKDFTRLLKQAGFTDVMLQPMMFGAVMIYCAAVKKAKGANTTL
ncbi:MAG: ubiquinone/menaquinone biosynthesis methyltransferase [Candidatus Omnitrophota bacterium]